VKNHTFRRSALVTVVALWSISFLSASSATAASAIGLRALRGASEVLAQFHVPAGSRVVVSPPPETNPNILIPAPLGHGAFGSPYLIDLHRYYVVPGSAKDFATWLVSHPPAGWSGFIIDGRCNATAVGHRCILAFGHANTGEWKGLNSGLLVKAIVISGHRTVVRVDTDFSWFGPKNQFDVVPSGATVMTVSTVGLPANHLLRTVRGEAVINAFRKRLASLHVFSPKQICVTNLIYPLYLYSFSTSPKALPFAQVEVNLSGCIIVDVEVHGHPGTELIGDARGFQSHLP
jgi:hypothetical protein